MISVVFTDGDMSTAYPIGAEQLQAIADTMQKTASDAAAAIKKIGDESVLVFLLRADSRKAVREAAEKRLSSLYSGIASPHQSAPGAAQEGAGGNPEHETQ